MNTLFLLLVVYQLKHFLADYPLQGRYMLGKFLDKGWVKPLAAHVAVHGLMTAAIAIAFGHPWLALPLALLDAGIHFIMDRLKAGKKYLGRYKALSANDMVYILSYVPTLGEDGVRKKFGTELRSNTIFWWCLGIDQMVHHLTHYLCIFILMY